MNTAIYAFPTDERDDMRLISAIKPEYKTFTGKFICLRKLDIEPDIDFLYSPTHSTEEQRKVWQHLPYGPFLKIEDMKYFYGNLISSENRLVYCVCDAHKKLPVGVVALENIEPSHATLEIGGILYSIGYQRTKINTEVIYLLLKDCIENLHYRRITWRCNNKNLASKRAAERLGFEFEGLFHHHMIVKNSNRDTAWFALLKERWPTLAKNYEEWLYGQGEYTSLAMMNKKVQPISYVRFYLEDSKVLAHKNNGRSKL